MQVLGLPQTSNAIKPSGASLPVRLDDDEQNNLGPAGVRFLRSEPITLLGGTAKYTGIGPLF